MVAGPAKAFSLSRSDKSAIHASVTQLDQSTKLLISMLQVRVLPGVLIERGESMCRACAEACREIFPEVPDDEMGDFLISTTCYPFGEATQVRSQLVTNRDKMTTSDWHECYAISDREMDEVHLQCNGKCKKK